MAVEKADAAGAVGPRALASARSMRGASMTRTGIRRLHACGSLPRRGGRRNIERIFRPRCAEGLHDFRRRRGGRGRLGQHGLQRLSRLSGARSIPAISGNRYFTAFRPTATWRRPGRASPPSIRPARRSNGASTPRTARSVPFAAIHRWFVSADARIRTTDRSAGRRKGRPDRRREGCAVGLVHRDRQSRKPTRRRARSRTSGRAISPAASTSGWSSAARCRTSAAARTDHFFLARSIASTIICLARALSYQPPILTHLPGSRSL